MANEAPLWLQNAFEEQSRQITEQSQRLIELAASQAASMATLAGRVASIKDQPVGHDETLHVPAYMPASTPDPVDVARPRQRLPKTKVFDGTNKALYP